MSAKNIVMSAAGAAGGKLYVDDVFSTYLYTGNGSTQTITNGIDLAGEGGMVWFKARSSALSNVLQDTAQPLVGGFPPYLISNSAAASTDSAGTLLRTFASNGFDIGTSSTINNSANIYASWTFRKAPKFFDVVTWTGDGTAGRSIAHALGTQPGMIIVKRTNTSENWRVYHKNSLLLQLNTSGAEVNALANYFGDGTSAVPPTSSVFTVGASNNISASTYVAYLFAHDTDADGMIQCGGFTTVTSSDNITLPWEPQFLILKDIENSSSDWLMLDTMRGWANGSTDSFLKANLSDFESTTGYGHPQANGFQIQGLALERTYIYLAIRRPNKPPTIGTEVFMPTVYTGTNTDNRLINTTIAPDMVWLRQRNGSGSGYPGFVVGDRLRGQPWLTTGSNVNELAAPDALDRQLVSSSEYGTSFSSMSGVWVGNRSGSFSDGFNANANTTANNHIALAFKRAPGFFDIVCYTSTGSTNRQLTHNLSTVPELVIMKGRSVAYGWGVYHASLGRDKYLYLNSGAGDVTEAGVWTSTAATSTTFNVNESTFALTNGSTAVLYLFATLPGISKVGSYTGTGTSQTIDCGFSTGARFVLIKRTDSTDDWYVWDTARGIVAANDPHLSLNSIASEVTIYDSVDPDNSGFIVNQNAKTNINVNAATYIYLAIS